MKATDIIADTVEMPLHSCLINCKTVKKLDSAQVTNWRNQWRREINRAKEILLPHLDDYKRRLITKIFSIFASCSLIQMISDPKLSSKLKSYVTDTPTISWIKLFFEKDESVVPVTLETQALSVKNLDQQPSKLQKFVNKKKIVNLAKRAKCAVC